MCQCSSSCACESSIELPYINGNDGFNGIFGGYSAKWIFDSTTSVNPPSSKLRFNSNAMGSVTNIYVNVINGEGINYSGFLSSFLNSSNYGWIRIFKESDNSKFWTGKITGITLLGSGTYYQLSVTITDSNGTFSNGDDVVLSFVPKGETGTAGSNATTKAYIWQSFAQTPYVQHKGFGSTGNFTQTLTIPSNNLTLTGDKFEFEAIFNSDADNNILTQLKIYFNGSFEIVPLTLIPGKNLIRGSITRTATQPHYVIINEGYLNSGSFYTSQLTEGHSSDITDFTVNNTISFGIDTNPFSGGIYLKKLQSQIIKK